MTTEETVKMMLEEYSEIQAQINLLDQSIRDFVEKTIPKDVKEKIEEYQAEILPKINALSSKLENKKKEISSAVSEIGKTVKSSTFMCVYSESVEVDDAVLDKLVEAYPQIAFAKSVWDAKKVQSIAEAFPEVKKAIRVKPKTYIKSCAK